MARKTIAAIADLIEHMVDKDTADTAFDSFVQEMINLSIQEIISQVPHARWLLDEDSVSTTSGTNYVTLPTDMDIDMFRTMRDETGNRKVRRISPEDADMIDPGRDLTGDEILWWHQRVGGTDRIYFLYEPDSTDTLKLIFGNLVDDMASGSTCPVPAKYEWVIINMTLLKIKPRVGRPDLFDWPLIASLADRGLQTIIRDANKSPGQFEALASHRPRRTRDDNLGAQWPSNFDVTP